MRRPRGARVARRLKSEVGSHHLVIAQGLSPVRLFLTQSRRGAEAAELCVKIYGGPVPVESYDAKSRRVKKVTPNATTTFFYDDWNLVEERIAYADNTTSTIRYYWGRDLSGSFQGGGGVGGLLWLTIDGVVYIPCYDNNGNVTRYLNANGGTFARYSYDAFGRLIARAGRRASFFRHRFSTKYHDREVGLISYQLRSYSPTLGRWLNRDPIEEEGGVNLYVFCGNLTIDKHLGSSLDYLGLSCCPGEIRIISIVYADASSISRGNPDFKNLRELLRNLELLNYIQLGISGVSSVLDGLIAGVEKGVTSAAASGADFIVGKAVSLDGGVGVSAIEQMYTRYKVNFPQLRGWLYYQQCEKHMLIFTRWVDKSISSTEAVAIDLHGMDGSNPIKTFEAAEAEIKAELLTKFKKVLGGGR